jgi:uncharacterized membrane protein
MDLSIENDTISAAGRAAHDVGLAAMLGGNLFARVAMHPALAKVSDERERGAVVNNAWRRYGTVNSLGLAAVIAGWGGARATETQPKWLTDRERSIAKAKDVTVAVVAVTGVASAIQGVRFAKACPDGRVPLDDGSTPNADTPSGAARQKRVLNALSAASIASEVVLWGINAAMAQANFRRPAKRRVLKRSW